METSTRTIGDLELTIHTVKTMIVGAGAAGLNAAEHLHDLGHDDYVIVTSAAGGLSGDPAAAKPTYYRMGMDWETPDSPRAMAEDLVDRGMTHGDTAYVEAVNSIPEFLHLVNNGVPFPRDEYGNYLGSGEKGRCATAGPQTSVLMTQKSDGRVKANRTKVFGRHEVIALLVADNDGQSEVVGALAVDLRKATESAKSLVVFNCRNVILATGSASALFANCTLGEGSPSGMGLALKAGAGLANLTETRFGIALAKARRPLAGNCQRVIPTYYSTGRGGRTKEMFFSKYFDATRQIASSIFLKGEAWPFSTARLQALGPSIIDIAVYNEMAEGRRVFVSYAENVKGEEIGQFNITQLDPEARTWLEKNGATQFTPFDRLQHVDPESIKSLLEFKVDLREPQEVTLCAEETFGGVAVNTSWETGVAHLFAVGDVSCTHGNPPEGAELNARQVGGLRAAERITRDYSGAPMPLDNFVAAVGAQLQAEITNVRRYVYGPLELPSVRNVRTEIQQRTDKAAGMIRGVTGLSEAISDTHALYGTIRTEGQRLARASEFAGAIGNELLCITQLAFLEQMKAYIEAGGGSRGAYLVLDERGDATILTKRGSEMRHRNENMGMRNCVFETVLTEGTVFQTQAVPVRAIPPPSGGEPV
jgi:succinate dehydrogenase/fumarate reductase flavoprotein subunit